MVSTKWSDDAFLDALRHQTDVWADEVLEFESPEAVDRLIFNLIFNESQLPPDASGRVREFFEKTDGLPKLDDEPIDFERVDRGKEAFWQRAFPCASVLVTKCMIEGYAAPALTKILILAGDLEKDTYRRLITTLEMLIDVSAANGFKDEHRGQAVVTAQKLRLLHAALRHDVRRMIRAQCRSRAWPGGRGTEARAISRRGWVLRFSTESEAAGGESPGSWIRNTRASPVPPFRSSRSRRPRSTRAASFHVVSASPSGRVPAPTTGGYRISSGLRIDSS